MGYYSDVCLAFVVETKELRDEIMAVYAMDPRVQKYDCLNHWNKFSGKDYAGAYISMTRVKWYDAYDDVKAFHHMEAVVEMFDEQRGIKWATAFYRIGENDDDIETSEHQSQADDSLREVLWDCMHVRREIEVEFPTEAEETEQ